MSVRMVARDFEEVHHERGVSCAIVVAIVCKELGIEVARLVAGQASHDCVCSASWASAN